MNAKKDLSAKQLLTMGGALFSMHFGASCMLYPVNWGKDSGTSVFIAYIAIVLTALLLPLLLAWYILTELGSILENAIALGAQAPGWLTAILQNTLKAVNDLGEKTMDN